MRRFLLLFLLLGAGIIIWLVAARPSKKQEPPKAAALVVSKHSPDFNNAVATTIEDYNKLSEAFVNWDSSAASAAAVQFSTDLARINLSELKKDSAGIYETAESFIENAKGDAKTIEGEKAIRPQREGFNSLTDNFYQFLNMVKYDRQKLFLQQCPMAFDDTKPGIWLSQKEEIRNPYLGLHHPTYGKAMLTCGETKTKINNTGVQ